MPEVNATYLVDLNVAEIKFGEGSNSDAAWIHALPIGSYKHPVYGTIDITTDRVKRFMDNVKQKILGTVDPSINYEHDNNGPAAGWVKDADSRSDGLWLFVEFVKDAAVAIREKKWRYFSSEFHDEWEDAKGTKHKDVIKGGGITNRPFMKNLVPINLSETTVETALELVSLISGTPIDDLKGGRSVPLSDEDLDKLATKLAEKTNPKPITPPEPTGPKLTEIPELKQLAEENPLVKILIQEVETQRDNNAASQVALKEKDVATKLADFDRSKIVLTPVARELVRELAMELSEDSLGKFWQLLTEMRKGSSFLVELGERAGATVNYGTPKSAIAQFKELTDKLKAEHKLSEADAAEMAAAQNRNLYDRYRGELMSGNGVTR